MKILLGRNALENDALVNSMGGKDYWFHARDYPGSHVVVKGDKPTELVLDYAARLAATHSKSKGSTVEVIMCRGVDVIKPANSEPGSVFCTNPVYITVEKCVY